ncbi:MAG: DUF202 domain-containing protein [Dehalococcoidales bacterium]|nr:DUF202 domain-containing protein [Dehalococcoidales bacterium]
METKNNPYIKFIEEELILRDYLAADRTVLANERTFLAYLRTAIAIAAAGAALIQLFDSTTVIVIGWIMIPAAIGTAVVGILHYLRMRRILRHITEMANKIACAEEKQAQKTGKQSN